jgi:hypothetical protein
VRWVYFGGDEFDFIGPKNELATGPAIRDDAATASRSASGVHGRAQVDRGCFRAALRRNQPAGLPDEDQLQLAVHDGIDAERLVLPGTHASANSRIHRIECRNELCALPCRAARRSEMRRKPLDEPIESQPCRVVFFL